MYRGFLNRLVVAAFAIGVSTVTSAGDVDTHFDRSRGRPAPVRNPASEVRTDGAKQAAEIAAKKAEPTALATAHRRDCTCPAGMHAK